MASGSSSTKSKNIEEDKYDHRGSLGNLSSSSLGPDKVDLEAVESQLSKTQSEVQAALEKLDSLAAKLKEYENEKKGKRKLIPEKPDTESEENEKKVSEFD